MLTQGAIVQDNQSLDGLRAQMAQLMPRGTVYVFPDGNPPPDSACGDADVTACVLFGFDGTGGLIPSISSSLAGINEYWLTILGQNRVALADDDPATDEVPALQDTDMALLEQVRNQNLGDPYTIQVSHDPGSTTGIQIQSAFKPGDVLNDQLVGAAPLALYFGANVEFDPPLDGSFHCLCNSDDPHPTPLPLDGCDTICTSLPLKQDCDIYVTVRVRRTAFEIGLGPTAPTTGQGLWTTQLFPGAKNFHVPNQFDVELFGVYGAKANATQYTDPGLVFADPTSSMAINVSLSVSDCNDWCGEMVADCDGKIAAKVADTFSSEIGAGVGEAVHAQLEELMSYDEPTLPAPCSLDTSCFEDPPPAGCCSEDDLMSFVRASFTYQKWHWFLSAFGPYDNGGYLPVTATWADHGDLVAPFDETITWVFSSDPDDDTILTPDDNCPFLWNEPQVDSDGDGMGNACDSCPLDPENDADGDGVCGDVDNCPMVANANQYNCNAEAEQAQTPSLVLGNACDPVPCPNNIAEPESTTEFESGDSNFWVKCDRVRRGKIQLRPLASHDLEGEIDPVMVSGVPTRGRYCIEDLLAGRTCKKFEDFSEVWLDQNDCARLDAVSLPPCADYEDEETRFHRLSFSQGGNGTSPNSPNPPILTYWFEADGQYLGAAGYHWRWDYASDLARWQDTNITDLPDVEALDGTLGLYAETEVGDQDLNKDTGYHGDDLSSQFQVDYVPERLVCDSFIDFIYIDKTFGFIWMPDPAPEAFHRWDAVRDESSLILSSQGEWGALDRKGALQVMTSRMGTHLLESLADDSLVWANAVEPLRAQGASLAGVVAVALSEDGSQIVDTVRSSGQMLLGDLDRNVIGGERVGSPYATDYAAILSRTRRGVFVIGGLGVDSGEPTGEIWFTPLDGDRWSPVAADLRPEHVLAATYSFATDELVVLDQSGEELRLWAVAVRDGTTRWIGVWPRHAEWTGHALVIDRDGAVLLASSRAGKKGKKEHRVARIDLRPQRATVTGVMAGSRALALPPVVDAAGYTLVLHKDQGNHEVKVERLQVIDWAPATLADLGAQL